MSLNSDFRILLLDDEPTIVRFLAELLHQNGYNVLPLCSPEDALEHVEHLRFELAIVGIRMPGMSSIEVADQLRQRLLTCKILLMDGNELVESVRPHRRDFNYLPIPFESRELLDRVREFHQMVRSGV